ncbi:C40 family peptidase [Nocardiopsis halophila]|uniref:C40 family peptidase n=1 Tax=Nocardiopsis halophila TaxID=141692 RepID=UPI0003723331|nr:C40 family peptidase [Nocardiopsis halophila]
MEQRTKSTAASRATVRLLSAVLLALALALPTTATAHASTPAQGQAAVAFAREQIGKPYVWGATGPDSWDGAGLAQAAWSEAGFEIPRTSFAQADLPHKVQRDDLRPGDLMFFYYNKSHVGIYVGEGRMVHADRAARAVEEEELVDYWWSSLTTAVRPG